MNGGDLADAQIVQVERQAVASLHGWHRHAGDSDDMLSVEHFGASAPANALLREYGFSIDKVARRARALMGGRFVLSSTCCAAPHFDHGPAADVVSNLATRLARREQALNRFEHWVPRLPGALSGNEDRTKKPLLALNQQAFESIV